MSFDDKDILSVVLVTSLCSERFSFNYRKTVLQIMEPSDTRETTLKPMYLGHIKKNKTWTQGYTNRTLASAIHLTRKLNSRCYFAYGRIN